jgi:periplasmic divalent cation tolerance protein
MTEEAMVVLSTAPDDAVAKRLASFLVEGKLAACVNVVPGIRSIFWWDGELHDEGEVLLICKTDAERLSRLTEVLQREHPYDCPEVVALPVVGGAPEYLAWISGVLDG